MLLCCAPTGCTPGLDAATSAQNGLEADCGNEEYTLMSIDNIINGKVKPNDCVYVCRVFLSTQPHCLHSIWFHSSVILMSSTGGSLPRTNPHPELLSGKHGGGRGHPLHHSELSETHQKTCLW